MQIDKIIKSIQENQDKFLGGLKDVKNPETMSSIRKFADFILKLGLSASDLVELEKTTCAEGTKGSFSNLTHLAIKIAKSKSILRSLTVKVSIVMPAYGENTRMKKRGTGANEDPNGEDFIVEKNKQLKWLFDGSKSTYTAFIIDDMSKADPITSGAAAEIVIQDNGISNFEVLYLEKGVKEQQTKSELFKNALSGVLFPKNTKKAGAVYYGAAYAINSYGDGDDHVILITDCDLSVDLGQIGNLVAPIVLEKMSSGAGSRRLQESILEIAGSRNLRANTARYFRQLLLPGLLPKDTQCGAKAFSAKAMVGVLNAQRKVLDFAFDIELFTLVALQNGPKTIVPVAVAWFDSAELTTTDSSVHFGIMKAQLAIAKANNTGSGDVFEHLVRISQKLTESEEIWLDFLSKLENKPELVEAMQDFDTTILNELESLIAEQLSAK